MRQFGCFGVKARRQIRIPAPQSSMYIADHNYCFRGRDPKLNRIERLADAKRDAAKVTPSIENTEVMPRHRVDASRIWGPNIVWVPVVDGNAGPSRGFSLHVFHERRRGGTKQVREKISDQGLRRTYAAMLKLPQRVQFTTFSSIRLSSSVACDECEAAYSSAARHARSRYIQPTRSLPIRTSLLASAPVGRTH